MLNHRYILVVDNKHEFEVNLLQDLIDILIR